MKKNFKRLLSILLVTLITSACCIPSTALTILPNNTNNLTIHSLRFKPGTKYDQKKWDNDYRKLLLNQRELNMSKLKLTNINLLSRCVISGYTWVQGQDNVFRIVTTFKEQTSVQFKVLGNKDEQIKAVSIDGKNLPIIQNSNYDYTFEFPIEYGENPIKIYTNIFGRRAVMETSVDYAFYLKEEFEKPVEGWEKNPTTTGF